ncbi:hypothetical protein R6Q57_002121, partial [Mikania cordata]
MPVLFLVQPSQAVCIEEERMALLEIKDSLINSYGYEADKVLRTWVDLGECCDWERVMCNTTTGHVTRLSLQSLDKNLNIGIMVESENSLKKLWPLNVSLFLHFEELTSLNLSSNYLDNQILNTALTLTKLETLILSQNSFNESIISSLKLPPSLKNLDLSGNQLSGPFPRRGLCELKNIQELDLSRNMLNGNLPTCFSKLSSLKLLEISSNQFTGMPPQSLIANLTALEYIDFSRNNFEGSFSFSSFSNLTKLEVVKLTSNNGTLEVETEDPIGWIPLFQLKFLMLLNCNMNMAKGSVLDLSHNSLEGQFPNWLIKNNTELQVLNLRNNSFDGNFSLPLYENANAWWIDISSNQITGIIPNWMSNIKDSSQLVLNNNMFEGEFPCGPTSFLFLDISENLSSGSIPSCLNLQYVRHLHLGSNRFTGSIPNSFINLTNVLTLDIGNNNLSGRIPKFLGELENLRILLTRENNFT